jgi:hypothetical protein
MNARVTVGKGNGHEDKVLNEMWEVIKKAITNNEKKTGYRNLHTVYSGFLTFAKGNWKISKQQVIDNLTQLEAKGLIVQRPTHGGYKIYFATDAKAMADKSESSKFQKLLND